MKKTISLLLTAVLLCGMIFLPACSGKKGGNDAAETTAEQTDTSLTDTDIPSGQQNGPTEQGEETVASDPAAETQQNKSGDVQNGSSAENGESQTKNNEAQTPQTDENNDPAAQEEEVWETSVKTGVPGGPEVTVSVDRSGALRAGDRFTVTFHLHNAERLVCLGVSLEYNTVLLTAVGAKTLGAVEMESINYKNGPVRYSGLVMKTADIGDADLFNVTFTVNQDVNTTVTEITTEIQQFLVGKDAEGKTTQEIKSDFPAVALALNLHG